MAKKFKCIECEHKTKTLFNDPRIPPLDEEDCLCIDCYIDAAEERLLELEDELDQLKTERKQIEARL